MIVYATGLDLYTYIHTVIISERDLASLTPDELLSWEGTPHHPRAGFVSFGETDNVRIERDSFTFGAKTLRLVPQLVFIRQFEGMKGPDASSVEILQEYAHATEIHFLEHQNAFCRYDPRGELDLVVSITFEQAKRGITLVSFKRDPLDRFLAASKSALVRMFDFTLLRYDSFPGWPNGPETLTNESDTFHYRQKVVPGTAAYTTGAQIIRPRRPSKTVLSSIKTSQPASNHGPHVAFTAWDWRNQRIADISTDPSATTNYFQARHNALPFEMSPAFFSPEVLLRYKGDRDKYTIGERTISCRNAWELRDYDSNDADQLHVYICRLRNLPYREQLYWKSFNEMPTAGLSERAVAHDFEGEWTDYTDAVHDLTLILKRWDGANVTWWQLRDPALLERVSPPRTTSRDEWSAAFMALSQLITEGFRITPLRAMLQELAIPFDCNLKSLALIEKLLLAQCYDESEPRLDGLRTVQLIRSKVHAHSGSSEADRLTSRALREHGSFRAHFENTCRIVQRELRLIEQAFQKTDS